MASGSSTSPSNLPSKAVYNAPQTQPPQDSQPCYPVSLSPPPSHYPPLLASISLSIPASNFIIGCSPILFHLPTLSVVLVHDTYSNHFFLPRGRKDRNESLQSCALREGYEESGYRGELLNWGSTGTLQPQAPGLHRDDRDNNTEAFWVHMRPMARRDGTIVNYFTYYFIGIIPDDSKPDEDRSRLVGHHEQGYVGKLVEVDKATRLLAKQRRSPQIFRRKKPEPSGQGTESGLVFVPFTSSGGKSEGSEWEAFTAANSLRENGKVWMETSSVSEGVGGDKGEGKEAQAAARTRGGLLQGSVEVALPPAQEVIDAETAEALSDQGKGGLLVPAPESGEDDARVQARVVWEAWRTVVKISGELKN